jgi:DNA-binding response OmpR family regulator
MDQSEKKILVVDDEELLRSSLAKFLERNGYSVIMAESGNKAYDLITSEVCLVISDVRMPDGDGPSLLERLTNNSEEKPAFMFMTGFSEFSDEDLRKMGALHIFDKPVNRQEILAKVKEYFQNDA